MEHDPLYTPLGAINMVLAVFSVFALGERKNGKQK